MAEQLNIALKMLVWRQNRKTTIGRLNSIATQVNVWHGVSLVAKGVSGVSNVLTGAVTIGFQRSVLEDYNEGKTVAVVFCLVGWSMVTNMLATGPSMFDTWLNAQLINSKVLPILDEDKKQTRNLGNLITTLQDVYQEQLTRDTAVCNMISHQEFKYLEVLRMVETLTIVTVVCSHSESYPFLKPAFKFGLATFGVASIVCGVIKLRNVLSQTHCIAATEIRIAASKLQEQLDDVESDMEALSDL